MHSISSLFLACVSAASRTPGVRGAARRQGGMCVHTPPRGSPAVLPYSAACAGNSVSTPSCVCSQAQGALHHCLAYPALRTRSLAYFPFNCALQHSKTSSSPSPLAHMPPLPLQATTRLRCRPRPTTTRARRSSSSTRPGRWRRSGCGAGVGWGGGGGGRNCVGRQEVVSTHLDIPHVSVAVQCRW